MPESRASGSARPRAALTATSSAAPSASDVLIGGEPGRRWSDYVLLLAGIAVTWLRGRRAGGEQAAAARRDLAVALALGACWAAVWVLYATYTWTAVPGLSTLQAARFYVPALGAISLLGAWLLVRVPRRQPLIAITTLAVVAALFGLGGWAFHDMYKFPFGPQFAVVPGPGGTVSSSQARKP